jgi:hypothetical protein
MRKGVSWALSAVLLLALISCGGGGGGGGEDLSGTLNVTSFVIPAGQSRTVTGNLIVNSVQDLRIEGELLITPGARVALYSEGTVGIHGPIHAAPGRKPITRQDEPSGSIHLIGRNVEITQKNTPFVVETAAPGDGIFITTSDPNGTVTISQDMVTKAGDHSTERGRMGGRSGDIFIGTDPVIQVAQADGKAAAKPKSVTITSTLRTGRGGNGFTDLSGEELADGSLFVRGTFGGASGDIMIDSARLATDPKIPLDRLIAGHGGDAGSSGAPGKPVRARSGQAIGEAGQSVKALPGIGGSGGKVTLGAVMEHQAEVGIEGSVYVAAGNGGPGGDGGNTTVEVLVREIARTDVSFVELVDGGNGGPAPTESVRGGTGGNVTFVVHVSPEIATHGVRIENYGNGGAGFGGCSATPPLPGMNGGAGGNLTVPPPRSLVVSDSFRGGRGGDGTPPGAKGAGGTFTRDGTRYPDGADGATCGTAGVSELVFDQQEVSLSTNEEKLVTLTRRGPLAAVQRLIQVTIRSEDGGVALIRNLATDQVGKSFTLPWPNGVSTIAFKVVGGVFYHNEPDIVATIVDSEFGGINSSLEIINSQRLTTRVELTSQSGAVIPAGTVFSVMPDGAGRVGALSIAPPGGGCDKWHGVHGASGFITIDGSIVYQPEGACGYGEVIQPQHATDRSRAMPRRK